MPVVAVPFAAFLVPGGIVTFGRLAKWALLQAGGKPAGTHAVHDLDFAGLRFAGGLGHNTRYRSNPVGSPMISINTSVSEMVLLLGSAFRV
jgi:hypothetical protein